MVDRCLREFLQTGAKIVSLTTVTCNSREFIRPVVMKYLLPQLVSLKCNTREAQVRIRNMVELACELSVDEALDPDEAYGFGVPIGNIAGHMVSSSSRRRCFDADLSFQLKMNQEVFGEDRIPCRCDLTHHASRFVDSLTHIRRQVVHDMALARENNSLYPIKPSILHPQVEEMLDAGTLSAECWRGDWKKDFAKFMKFVDPIFLE